MHTIATSIVEHSHNHTCVVDTTGSFDPKNLLDILVEKLVQPTPAASYRHDIAESEDQDMLSVAMGMLDRVHIMRVFDSSGMIDAIQEVDRLCEAYQLGNAEAEQGELEPEIADSDDEESLLASPVKPRTQDVPMSHGREQVAMLVVDNVGSILGTDLVQNQVRGKL